MYIQPRFMNLRYSFPNTESSTIADDMEILFFLFPHKNKQGVHGHHNLALD